MPDLRDILKKHGLSPSKTRKTGILKSPAKKPEKRVIKKPVQPNTVQKHIVLKADDARQLFFDLPKEHRFWLKSGRRLKNLMELFEELKVMSDTVFSHHVSENRNDFAAWISDVYKDGLLAHQLKSAETKQEHIEIIARRIEEMKSQVHKARRPKSHIKPDLNFLRKSFNKSELHTSLETKRRIIPRTISPDYSFIRLDKAYIDQKNRIKEESSSLKAQLAELEKQVEAKKTELENIADSISQKEKKARELELLQRREKGSVALDALQQKNENIRIIHDLKQQEAALMSQLSELERFEANLAKKAEQLHEKELMLAHKQRIIEKKHNIFGNSNIFQDTKALISQAALLAKEKRYKESKELISRARESLAENSMPEEERKLAYYRLLEIATEVDLALLK